MYTISNDTYSKKHQTNGFSTKTHQNIFQAAVWSLLIWGRSLFHMQIMQAAFGWAAAAEIAYFSYIYATVAPELYQTLTSYVRMMTLAGRCLGYGTGLV